MKQRELIETDVLIIGGGPAGLATAIHLADLAAQANRQSDKENLSIFVVEKGSAIGSHSISGGIIDPRSLAALLPDIPVTEMPFDTPVTKSEVLFFTQRYAIGAPFSPPYMDNRGNYVISLGKVTRWLAKIAEAKGVQVFSGISAHELLFENEKVVGVRTGDSGVDEHGVRHENYQPGSDIRARLVVLADGARGHLTKIVIDKLGLAKDKNPQAYSQGVKELWEVPEGTFAPGRALHAMGWPLEVSQFGGGFVYGVSKTQISVGMVIGLDYEDPTFDPHNAFQLFKQHPLVADLLKHGKLLRYGAKAVPEGGIFSLPRLCSDNVMVVGDAAGFLAMPALKGIHLGIESGMLAAKAAWEAVTKNDFSEKQLALYEKLFKASEAYQEMQPVRNFRQGFQKNLFLGMLNFGALLLTGGRGLSLSGRLRMHDDGARTQSLEHACFQKKFKANLHFDHQLTFDKATDVFYSRTKHGEHQPCHLIIPDLKTCQEVCIPAYGGPCQYFCPAEVYEIVSDEKTGRDNVIVHPENCVHCKTCDIKDPFKNITWVTPHGGDGPEYENL